MSVKFKGGLDYLSVHTLLPLPQPTHTHTHTTHTHNTDMVNLTQHICARVRIVLETAVIHLKIRGEHVLHLVN